MEKLCGRPFEALGYSFRVNWAQFGVGESGRFKGEPSAAGWKVTVRLVE